MENTSSNGVARKSPEEILIGTLSKLSPPDIFKSEELENCFREFLSRGTLEDCLNLLPQCHKTVISNSNDHNVLPGVPQYSLKSVVVNSPSMDLPLCGLFDDTSTRTVPLLKVISSNFPKVLQLPYSSSNSVLPLIVSSCTKAPTAIIQPRSTVATSLSSLSDSVTKYFQAKSIAPNRIPRLIRLIRSFGDAKPLDLKSYGNLWFDKGKVFDGPESGLGRMDRLHRGRLKIEKEKTEYECAARLCLMFWVNDVVHCSLTATANELDLRQNRRRMTAALEKVAHDTKIPKASLKKDQKYNRNYFHVLAKKGPGSLLELGSGAISDWEVKASEEDIDLVLEYRETHLPDCEKRAKKLNGVGARTIVDGLLEYGWTSDEVISSPTPFLKLVRKYLDVNLKPLDSSHNTDQLSEAECRVGGINYTSECDRSSGHLESNKRSFGNQSVETPTSQVISDRFGQTATTEASGVHFPASAAISKSPQSDMTSSDQGIASMIDRDLMRFLDSSGELPDFGLSFSQEIADEDWVRFLDSSGALPNLGLSSGEETMDQDWMRILDSSGELPDPLSLDPSEAPMNPNILSKELCTVDILFNSDYQVRSVQTNTGQQASHRNIDVLRLNNRVGIMA